MVSAATIDSEVEASPKTQLSGLSIKRVKKPASSRFSLPAAFHNFKVQSSQRRKAVAPQIRSQSPDGAMAEPPPLADEGKRATLHFVLLALSLPSCSAESAPLLRGDENEQVERPSLYHKLAEITSQPLTAISKLILAVCLLLLLLSSIFIGLFAGAQHKINKIRHAPVPEPTTVSVTATLELPVTLTETEISTSVSATTVVSITTAPAPPIPTPDPRTVCEQVPGIVKGVANLHHLSAAMHFYRVHRPCCFDPLVFGQNPRPL